MKRRLPQNQNADRRRVSLQTLSNQTIVMSTNSQANVSVMISADSRDTVEDNDASPPPRSYRAVEPIAPYRLKAYAVLKRT